MLRKKCNKPLLFALEIILGIALCATSLYLAHSYGVEITGLVGIGAGGIAIVILVAISTMACLRQKSNSSQTDDPKTDDPKNPESQPIIQPTSNSTKVNKCIKGKIAIFNYRSVGALGKDLTYLFPITEKIQTIDGKDWTQFPNEMLIECQIFNLQQRAALRDGTTLYHIFLFVSLSKIMIIRNGRTSMTL